MRDAAWAADVVENALAAVLNIFRRQNVQLRVGWKCAGEADGFRS